MPNVSELYRFLCSKIPAEFSLEWDNDGLLLCPDDSTEIKKVLVSLDADDDAVKKAIDEKCDVIITHHPIIFRPIKKITSAKHISLIKNNIAVMSFHTRLDRLDGGINDIFASIAGLENTYKFAEEAGRIGCVEPVSTEEYVEYLSEKLGTSAFRFTNTGKAVKKIAVVTGSGGDFVFDAVSEDCDLFISGEIGYHRMIDAYEAGMSCLEIGHDTSERYVIEFFTSLVKTEYPSVGVISSEPRIVIKK